MACFVFDTGADFQVRSPLFNSLASYNTPTPIDLVLYLTNVILTWFLYMGEVENNISSSPRGLSIFWEGAGVITCHLRHPQKGRFQRGLNNFCIAFQKSNIKLWPCVTFCCNVDVQKNIHSLVNFSLSTFSTVCN